MKRSAIERISAVHRKVVHAVDHSREAMEYTDEEYIEEDRTIGKIKSDYLLNQICPSCFPFLIENLKFKTPYPIVNRGIMAIR